MKKQWSIIKNIIAANQQKDLFLSLIDEKGTIVSANARMIKKMGLKDPRHVKNNFFDMVHPAHLDGFLQTLKKSKKNNCASAMELYLKNGYYHPMKWKISSLADGEEKRFLCTGYMLLDEERLRFFNQVGEKNYQHIVEGLNTGILFQDVQGELIAANLKAAEIFNTSLERLYQIHDIKNLWNTAWYITTEKGEPISFEKTPFMSALKTGKTQTQTLVIRLRNDETRWILFISQPLFEADKSVPFSVVSNIVDVTHEKKLSNELKERQALLQSFMKQTPNIAWVTDESESLVFASHSFYEYFRLDEKNCDNKKIIDLVPRAVANALYEKHIQVFRTGMPVETVEKVKWADGTNFIFHINIFPIEGIAGKKLVGGHAVNLADKYAVEKQLREANERLLIINRASNNAIWEWDMQNGKIRRNEQLLDMIGYPMEKTQGLSWWLRRIHPDDRNRVSDKVKDTTERSKMSWEDEYRFKCADGTYKHIHDRGYVVYENDLPVKMIGSLQDVTALKELEDQLMNEKLQRQKEISEIAINVQEKERTRIGHELHDNVNQILSTVKLFLDMLKPTDPDEIKTKERTIEYTLLAVEEIRKLSKELVAPELKEKSLIDSINKLIDDIHISTPIRIKLTHDYHTDLISPGKKITLFRIIQEQLKNIIKHSGAKNVNILLQSKADNTQLVVKDDGKGFDPKQTHRGIGLSNIYERARFYNGKVDIETTPGEGCILTVNIPN